MKLANKIVVISGASSGLGAALSRAFAQAGAQVIMLARTESALAQLAQEIQAAGGSAAWYGVDLGNLKAAEAVTAEIVRDYGLPDMLINNAGIGRFLAVDETTPQEAMEMLAVPYGAAFALTYGFLPGMIKRRAGLIVNITSPASRLPWPGATAYAVARWAMRGFNSALQGDLRGTGVRAMLVTPAKISSSYFANNPGSEERIPWVAKFIPTWSPEKVAAAIVEGVQKDKRELVMPKMLTFFFLLHRFFPRTIEWVMRVTGWKRPKT